MTLHGHLSTTDAFRLRLWREASTARTAESFLERVVDGLSAGAHVIALRVLDDSRQTLSAAAIFRRGASSLATPASSRTVFTSGEASSFAIWALEGALVRVESSDSSPIGARHAISGLGALHQGSWCAAPLAHEGQVLGVLCVGADQRADFRSLMDEINAIAEALAVVLSHERQGRTLSLQREAALAEKQAALVRLELRDIGKTVIGAESGLREVLEQVNQVAPTTAPVLLFGETGSGKEVVARAIHERSSRATGPVLRVNCGAIAPELLDSELFGHEKGSFTGAVAERRGWFERADGGTLFLDEIGELPLAAQVRLLRVLQDGVFERVGGQKPVRVDVRIVAATHRDLFAMTQVGSFRQDLWYRICVFTIRIPSLRDRPEDIPALATYFADRAGRRYGAGPLTVTEADVQLLRAYDWPGNVRELGSVIERAAILGHGRMLSIARALGTSAPRVVAEPALTLDVSPSQPEVTTLDDAMREHIVRILQRCTGRIEGPDGAAKLLSVNPHTLRSKMRKLGINWAKFRSFPSS